MTSNGELQKFTNIRSVAQVHGKGVTILFDGYTSTGKVPPSILLRGEKCDKDTHQVYVRNFMFRASFLLRWVVSY